MNLGNILWAISYFAVAIECARSSLDVTVKLLELSEMQKDGRCGTHEFKEKSRRVKEEIAAVLVALDFRSKLHLIFEKYAFLRGSKYPAETWQWLFETAKSLDVFLETLSYWEAWEVKRWDGLEAAAVEDKTGFYASKPARRKRFYHLFDQFIRNEDMMRDLRETGAKVCVLSRDFHEYVTTLPMEQTVALLWFKQRCRFDGYPMKWEKTLAKTLWRVLSEEFRKTGTILIEGVINHWKSVRWLERHKLLEAFSGKVEDKDDKREFLRWYRSLRKEGDELHMSEELWEALTARIPFAVDKATNYPFCEFLKNNPKIFQAHLRNPAPPHPPKPPPSASKERAGNLTKIPKRWIPRCIWKY